MFTGDTRSDNPGVDEDLMSKPVVDHSTQSLPFNFFSPKFIVDRFEVPNFHGDERFLLEYGDFNLFPDTNSMEVFSDRFENLMQTHNIQITRIASYELSNMRDVVDYMLIGEGIQVNGFKVIDSDYVRSSSAVFGFRSEVIA